MEKTKTKQKQNTVVSTDTELPAPQEQRGAGVLLSALLLGVGYTLLPEEKKISSQADYSTFSFEKKHNALREYLLCFIDNLSGSLTPYRLNPRTYMHDFVPSEYLKDFREEFRAFSELNDSLADIAKSHFLDEYPTNFKPQGYEVYSKEVRELAVRACFKAVGASSLIDIPIYRLPEEYLKMPEKLSILTNALLAPEVSYTLEMYYQLYLETNLPEAKYNFYTAFEDFLQKKGFYFEKVKTLRHAAMGEVLDTIKADSSNTQVYH